jgi:hypothetical protein
MSVNKNKLTDRGKEIYNKGVNDGEKLSKGKYVSRASFAKMQGERDRALKDVYTLVMNDNMGDVILLKRKWRDYFERNKMLTDALREIAKEQLQMLKAKIDSNPKAFK